MADQGSPKPKRLTLNQLGCRVSEWASDLAAQPLAQLGLLVFCVAWFALKLPTDLLTAALSILAITLTQMVLNRQSEREIVSHQRDVAMHAKLDELVLATKRARDEMAGIEELSEEKIARLKDNASHAAAAPPSRAPPA
jgi:low affinity Fe/Cu permease